MKTFVINLERSPQRREQILHQVEKYKLDYEFIKAVDGAELSDGEVERLIDQEALRREPQKLTRGSLGCLLSHLRVYEKMLAQNLETALVLEDDAVLPHDIKEILADIEQNIHKNEVVLLYFYSFSECELSEKDHVCLRGDYKLMYPVRVEQPVTATAYVVTREAARALLPNQLPMRMQCDEWGYFFKRGVIKSFRCVYPRAVRVSGAKSIIQRDLQSRLRVKLTEFFDENPVPFVTEFLRKARLADLQKKYQVRFVNQPSPVAETAAQPEFVEQ